MKAYVLASGSEGNSTFFSHNNCNILIDIGKNAKYISEHLKEINVEPKKIDAILISHTHDDHVTALKVFLKKNHPKVYITEKMYYDLEYLKDYDLENGSIKLKIRHTYEVVKKSEYIATGLKLDKENIKLASIQALGAINDFTVGVFKTKEKKYYANEFKGDYEIVSLTGTINTMNGEYYSHMHLSAGNDQGEVFGGHLNKAIVSATCEMVIQVINGQVDRYFDEEIGLNLLKL